MSSSASSAEALIQVMTDAEMHHHRRCHPHHHPHQPRDKRSLQPGMPENPKGTTGSFNNNKRKSMDAPKTMNNKMQAPSLEQDDNKRSPSEKHAPVEEKEVSAEEYFKFEQEEEKESDEEEEEDDADHEEPPRKRTATEVQTFAAFGRVLLRFLKQEEPDTYQRVTCVIRKCAQQAKQNGRTNGSYYLDFTSHLRDRIEPMVREEHWDQVRLHVCDYLQEVAALQEEQRLLRLQQEEWLGLAREQQTPRFYHVDD